MLVLYEFVKSKDNKIVDEINIFDSDRPDAIKEFLKRKRNIDVSITSIKYSISKDYVIKNNFKAIKIKED